MGLEKWEPDLKRGGSAGAAGSRPASWQMAGTGFSSWQISWSH